MFLTMSSAKHLCPLTVAKDLKGIEGHGLVEAILNGRQEVRLPWIPHVVYRG